MYRVPEMDASEPMSNTEAARAVMVDGQVRPNKVFDRRILDAMRALPRERFLPPHLAGLAYIDEDVKLPNGRALTEPLVIARLIQLGAPREGERALVVGAGTGYGAAVLAACGVEVTALEEDPALRAIAGPAFAAFAPSVRLVAGRLDEGWAEGAPWELILIDGAVCAIPERIAGQLRPGTGRLVTVVVSGGRTGRAVIAERVETGLKTRAVFDCATPVLPQFGPKAGFTF